MTDTTPVWALDVDGVLNAVCYTIPDGFSAGRAGPGSPDNRRYKIQWDPTIIERINELHASGKVRVLWLTTWGSGANGELRELLGINEFEVADEPPLYAAGGYHSWDAPPGGWWKLGTIIRLHEENPDRRIVWTDDDLALESHACEFVQGKNIFTVAPHVTRGLSHADIDAIEAFLIGQSAPKYRRHGFEVHA